MATSFSLSSWSHNQAQQASSIYSLPLLSWVEIQHTRHANCNLMDVCVDRWQRCSPRSTATKWTCTPCARRLNSATTHLSLLTAIPKRYGWWLIVILVIIVMIIMVDMISMVQFDTNGILTALQSHVVHMCIMCIDAHIDIYRCTYVRAWNSSWKRGFFHKSKIWGKNFPWENSQQAYFFSLWKLISWICECKLKLQNWYSLSILVC